MKSETTLSRETICFSLASKYFLLIAQMFFEFWFFFLSFIRLFFFACFTMQIIFVAGKAACQYFGNTYIHFTNMCYILEFPVRKRTEIVLFFYFSAQQSISQAKSVLLSSFSAQHDLTEKKMLRTRCPLSWVTCTTNLVQHVYLKMLLKFLFVQKYSF